MTGYLLSNREYSDKISSSIENTASRKPMQKNIQKKVGSLAKKRASYSYVPNNLIMPHCGEWPILPSDPSPANA